MNIKEHTTPDMLEKYSFLWSEVRLVIAALALFLGGVPPVLLVLKGVGLVATLLNLSWILSGVASVYLVYVWSKKGQTVFGGKQKYDLWAFWVMIVSGINLGVAGVLSQNIGMSISSNRVIFLVVGVLYLVSAYHLHRRFKANGERVF